MTQTQRCSSCHVVRPVSDFPVTKKGTIAKNCILCRKQRKKYEEKHKEEIKRKKKAYYEENKKEILAQIKQKYYEDPEKAKQKNKKSYEKNKQHHLEYKKKYYAERKEHYSQLGKNDRKNNPAKFLLRNAKKRAKEKKLPINITIEDIIVPDICPILGIPITKGNSVEKRDNSPSLDRIIPELGYVKGNIKVISFRANSLKRDGHIKDFENIIKYIKNNSSNKKVKK